MRLDEIHHSRNPLIKAAFWISKRQYGKVLSPLKVIYTRKPSLLLVADKMLKVQNKLAMCEEQKLLIKAYVASQNGCGFCEDIALAQSIQKGLGRDKFRLLANFKQADCFSEKERAILGYLEEYAVSRQVSDAIFNGLKNHCSEQEIIEITWLGALEYYFNALAIPLGIKSDGLARLAGGKS